MADKAQGMEDVSAFNLTQEEIEWFYANQEECIVLWTTKDGFPVGMPHLYVWHEGSFWVTMADGRPRVTALRNRPESGIVISSKGTSKGSGEMVSVRTRAIFHEDRETLRWFLPHFFDRAHYPREHFDAQFEIFFTPNRIVIEFKPIKVLSFSSHKVTAAVAQAQGAEAALTADQPPAALGETTR